MNKFLLLFAVVLSCICFQSVAQKKMSIQLPKIDKNVKPFTKTRINNSSRISRLDISAGCDSVYLNNQADINNFSSAHPNCDTIRVLVIDGENASPAITNLNGLNVIVAVTEKLIIENTAVANISGLSNLNYIGSGLFLSNNLQLSSIGLNQLTTLGRIEFRNQPLLNNISGFANNITTTEAIIIDTSALTNLNGLGNIQTLTHFDGLNIAHSPIVTLAALTNLKTINGYFRLDELPQLTSVGVTSIQETYGFLFAGLPNLSTLGNLTNNLTNTRLGAFWMINTGLTTIAGLDHITYAGNFYLWFNQNLTSLHGLEGLTGHGSDGMSFWENGNLTSVAALSNITSIGEGRLEINTCNALTNAAGLQNITELGALWITNNSFTSLDFLNSNLVIGNNDDHVKIKDNFQLAVCSFAPICNYLTNGGIAEISNNANGCNSITQVTAACASCIGGVKRTWTGDDDDNWDNANNWSPAGVPSTCDTVYIPESRPNYPSVNSNIITGGLIMESSTSLQLNSYNLTTRGPLNLYNAEINSDNNGNILNFRNAVDPVIDLSSLQGDVILYGYTGDLKFRSNNINGNVTITDAPERAGINQTGSNHIYGNFVMNITSTDNNATTEVSNNGDDEINGKAEFNITTNANFSIGSDGSVLRIAEDFILNTNIDSNLLYLGNVSFFGGTWAHIKQAGNTSISFINLYTDKYQGSQLILDQPVYIIGNVRFFGGLVKTTASNLLIFKHNAHINQYSSGSWVSGPVKKIGNEQFTFPIGNDQVQAVLTILAPPQATDAYTAQYFRSNPTSAGYDTSHHESSLTKISGVEYWMLNKDAGSSNILASLTYDSTRSNKTQSIYSLRTSQWNGTQWSNKGSIFLSGNLANATLTTASQITSYGQPLTLGYIEPPIVPKITIGTIDTVICRETYFKVRYTLDTLMFSGNQFRVELSDSTGSFNTPQLMAVFLSSNKSDSISVYVPFNQKLSELYRVRIVGNSPPDTSINAPRISIRSKPSLPLIILGPATGCAGSVQKYYAGQKEAGVTYAWSLNGGGTFTTNNDTIYVTWTTQGNYTISVSTSNICGPGGTSIKTVDIGYPTPTAAATLNKTGRWLYASAPDANQHAIGYHWYRNDVLIAGATSASYYANQSGIYKVAYFNNCGDGPASSTFVYADNSITQTITFPAVGIKTYGDTAFIINTSASSGFPVSLSIVSGPGTLANNVYTITTTGTVTIKALQLGDDVYDTAAYVFQTFTINKAAQTISFPAIGEKIFGIPAFLLNATSTSGLPVNYSLVSGPGVLSVNQLTLNGLGNISVKATQAGDTNYLAANAVNQTFCVRVAELNSITGALYVCPGQTATYKINKVPGLVYNWRLSNGTNYASTADSVNITWNSAGTYTLIVSATGPCGAPSANDSLVVNVINAVAPGLVSNMLPANGSTGQALPLALSWQPGTNALTYDLYLWDSALAQPSVPFAANLTNASYTVANNALQYNKTYKWRVVSKNACLEATGPIQQFRLRPLPDLIVSNVQIPASAVSGQTISLNWRVTNNGPGNTVTNQSWTDAVFLSFDTLPNFGITPNTNPAAWNNLEFPVRPLLVGSKANVTALDSGQHYDNSISFTLPLNYAQPLYLYVITNYPAAGSAPLQMNYANDTARAPQPINVTLAPTPDLRVDTVFTPASVFSGSTVNITYKVKNYGVLTPASSSWNDKIYISQSPVFNINTASLLKLVKPNGSYYPFAPDASFFNNGQLLGDSSYSRSIQAVIPNFIFGNYFIYVVTNTNNSLYEGLFLGNNINKGSLQIFLTPTPQLTINSLNIPVTQASTTQPLGITWNIVNTGFNDNIEKSKGHYYKQNGNCDGTQIKFTDSIGFGSSYWIDRVYLSKDSTGINGNAILIGEITHGVLNSGAAADYLPSVKCASPGTDPSSLNENTSNVVKPNSVHPSSLNFTIPESLAAGSYYVYVYANATKTVFEYPGAAQIQRSSSPIVISRPDLTVSSVAVPSSAVGGQSISIQYSVLNSGSGSVFSKTRKDKIYISSIASLDQTAQLISTQTFTENIAAGQTVNHAFSYSLPASISGSKFIIVETNYDSSFRETTYSNNTGSAGISLTAATPVDFTVNNVIVADSIFTIFPSTVRYTINNVGTANANGSWKDSLFVSCSPTFSYSTAYFVGEKIQQRLIDASSNYVDSFNLNMDYSWLINNCFPQTSSSTAYFFVRTNGNNGVYEAGNTNNNTGSSGAKILVNPLVDHIVTNVTAPDSVTVARPFDVAWIVKNIGYNPPDINNYFVWKDAVYFSTDSVFNNNAVFASHFDESSRLATNQTYSENRSAVTPKLATGDYYLFVISNYQNFIAGEKVLSNNSRLLRDAIGKAKLVHVTQPLLPDLIDSIITSPSSAAIGQTLNIVHRVKNQGAGITYPNKWSNDIWLSQDFIPGNAGDYLLSSKNHVGDLQANEWFNDTVSVLLSQQIVPGNYILLSKADAGNAMIESNDSNNVAYSFVNIYLPAPSDLIVQNIIRPDTVYLGYPFTSLQWTVVNNSPNPATGISSDGVYVSRSNTLDSTATLVAVLNKSINIPALGQSVVSAQPVVTTLTEGGYNLLVKTDILDNIVESNKNNNATLATGNIYVKAKELKLNITELNTLQSVNRYYKLVIPDSLTGATIRVSLQTNDSLTLRNEMFVGKSYVPSAAHYDYRYETPNYGNQQIIMSEVVSGDYYIMIRCISANLSVQNITINAVKLPFAVLMVQSNSGGNSGNVTVKISGSLFSNNMSAKLSKAGTDIFASKVYFINSTTVYATFNLRGKPLGLYDLSLTKQDASNTSLVGCFTVANPNNGGVGNGFVNNGPNGTGNDPGCDPGAEAGLNSLLLTELIIPNKVFAGWPFVIQINFSNPTNMDITVQTRTLYNDLNLPIAFTQAGLPNAKQSIYIEFSEPGGPPGIIRAGASGTIVLYCKAPPSTPGHSFVHFTLK